MASAAVPGTANVFGNQPVLVQQADAHRGFTEKNAKLVTELGVVQLAAGILAVVFQAAATGIEGSHGTRRGSTAEFIGCGIWCGIMFMTAGLLGILAGKRNKTGLIVAFLVFNIVISVIVWVLVGISAANLGILRSCSYQSGVKSRSEPGSPDYYYYYNSGEGPGLRTEYPPTVYTTTTTTTSTTTNTATTSTTTTATTTTTDFYTDYANDCSIRDGAVGRDWQAMDGLLLILAIFEFAIAVTSAAYCCRALSCCCTRPQPVFVLQQSAGPAGTYLYGPSMQPIFLQQGSSIQGQAFTNPPMFAGPMGYSTGLPTTQLHPQFAQETVSSSTVTGASISSENYLAPVGISPSEHPAYKNDPNAPPNYYELAE